MSRLILSFTDGTTFFAGTVLVLVAETLLVRLRGRCTRPILNMLAIVGLILVVLSATPWPLWAYLIWMVPAVVGLVLLNREGSSKGVRKVPRICLAVLFVSTVGLCLAEAQYHRFPRLRIDRETAIYVLGDSISAGTGVEHQCWPAVLAETVPNHVINLAKAGATANDAIVQAKGITGSHCLVVVAIGGNDLLGDTHASAFRADLNTLLSSLRENHHRILLVELPLIPFKNAFGQAQREMASQYDAILLPKRYFARVLATKDGTIDGLHLSQAGHDAMARMIADVIDPN